MNDNDFVTIIGFENYKINKKGIVVNPYGKQLATHLRGKDNYMCCHLYKDGIQHTCSIHRLLGIHFIPNPDNLPIVDHIDRNKLNNDLSNLRWVTASGNMKNTPRCESQVSYSKEYKAEKARQYRAAYTEEEKKEKLEHRREMYAKKEQTEEQKEAARERARKQREAIEADPEKLAQAREYKKQKAREYREKKKMEQKNEVN